MSHFQRNVFGTLYIYIYIYNGFYFEIKANEVGGVLSGTGDKKN